jgi:hypothetical protein
MQDMTMAAAIPAKASQVTTNMERRVHAAELQHNDLFLAGEGVRGDPGGNRLSRSESLLSSRVLLIMVVVVEMRRNARE